MTCVSTNEGMSGPFRASDQCARTRADGRNMRGPLAVNRSKSPAPNAVGTLPAGVELSCHKMIVVPQSWEMIAMENSVYQARWLLGPLFGLCLGFGVFGMWGA